MRKHSFDNTETTVVPLHPSVYTPYIVLAFVLGADNADMAAMPITDWGGKYVSSSEVSPSHHFFSSQFTLDAIFLLHFAPETSSCTLHGFYPHSANDGS